jgi:serine/threonine-protein kinase RsbW/stage II sporulation protein AB (anti-sigma F factor)
VAADPAFDREFRAEPASIPTIRQAVVALALDSGASAERCADVAIAVSEAATNAVVHAYVESAELGSVRVTATVIDGELEVTIADHGRGMLPRSDSPGLGLGMPLISSLATSFEIADSDGDGGTMLRMSFALDGPVA